MSLAKVAIVTSNFNSLKYIMLSKLSLYSLFRALTEGLTNEVSDCHIVLIDSASTDGSYEELRDLGIKLSKETSIPFICKRLDKDLGNSFAYAYGWLFSRKKLNTEYVILADNDFVVLYPKVLKELVLIAKDLFTAKIKYYSIAPLYLLGYREFLNHSVKLTASPHDLDELEQSYLRIINDVTYNSFFYFVKETTYIDDLGRAFGLPEFLRLYDFYKWLEVYVKNNTKRLLINAYNASSFALYRADLKPLFPYMYIGGDDIISSLEYSKRGYYNIRLLKFLGVHYVSQQGRSRRLYFTIRNDSLLNTSAGATRSLYYVIKALRTLVITIPAYLIPLKNMFRNAKLSRQESLYGHQILHTHSFRIDTEAIKYSMLGLAHGILYYKHFKDLSRKWFNELENLHDKNLLDSFRLSFSTWATSSKPFNMIKEIISYYILGPGNILNNKKSIELFLNRIRVR